MPSPVLSWMPLIAKTMIFSLDNHDSCRDRSSYLVMAGMWRFLKTQLVTWISYSSKSAIGWLASPWIYLGKFYEQVFAWELVFSTVFMFTSVRICIVGLIVSRNYIFALLLKYGLIFYPPSKLLMLVTRCFLVIRVLHSPLDSVQCSVKLRKFATTQLTWIYNPHLSAPCMFVGICRFNRINSSIILPFILYFRVRGL